MESKVLFSECGTYRYSLSRKLGSTHKRVLTFVLLNPSTANEVKNDPTVARCQKYAETHGYSEMIVVNLFGLRSTDPKKLKTELAPIGIQNLMEVAKALKAANTIIVGWGSNEMAKRWFNGIRETLFEGYDMYAFGTNLDGMPKHPLYVVTGTPLQLWKRSAA